MSVYVDQAVWKKRNGRKGYAHLVADTVDELHKFAESIGLKRRLFHRGSKYPHYDVTEEQRATAIAAGAVEKSTRELIVLLRRML